MLRVLASRMMLSPQIPQDAVLIISKGRATVCNPQIIAAIALAPDKLHATKPHGPPTRIRIHPIILVDIFFMAKYPAGQWWIGEL